MSYLGGIDRCACEDTSELKKIGTTDDVVTDGREVKQSRPVPLPMSATLLVCVARPSSAIPLWEITMQT